jgi:phospholipase A1
MGCAQAGEAPAGADCLGIEDDAERLACFDRAIGDAVAGTAPRAAAAAPAFEPRPGASSSGAPSMLDAAWGHRADAPEAYVRLHLPNYLLFARYTDEVNDAPYEPLFEAFAEDGEFENVETKFQLSLRGRVLATDDRHWGLWFAYTQQSHWQTQGGDISRPFRETNYMPELFGSFRPGVSFGDWQWNLLTFGYNHQSNGRSDPISRSWDRLFVEAAVDREDLALYARAWVRIRPGEYEDDNPDITDYLGYGELTALYRWREHTFSLLGRGNPATGKGAAQFNWTSPRLLGPFRGYLQVFTGYGESLIDYDFNQTTIGLGISMNEKL